MTGGWRGRVMGGGGVAGGWRRRVTGGWKGCAGGWRGCDGWVEEVVAGR